MDKYFAFLVGLRRWWQIRLEDPSHPFWLVTDENELRDAAEVTSKILRDRRAQRLKELGQGTRVWGLDIHLTHGCNLACAYCYQGTHVAKAICVSFEMVKSAMAQAISFFPKPLRVPFKIKISGGEPTLFPDLVKKIVALCRDTDFLAGVRVDVTLETNAMMLSSVESILPIIDLLDVSFDGVVHDEYRVTHGGKGSLQTVIDQLTKYQSVIGHKVKLNLVVTRPGLSRIRESLDLAWQVCPGAVISPMKSADMFWDKDAVSRRQFNNELLEVWKGLSDEKRQKLHLQILDMDVESRNPSCCGISGGQWVLLPDGTITTTPQAIGTHPRDIQMREKTLIATWNLAAQEHLLCRDNWKGIRDLGFLGQAENVLFKQRSPLVFFRTDLHCLAKHFRETGEFGLRTCEQGDIEAEVDFLVALLDLENRRNTKGD